MKYRDERGRYRKFGEKKRRNEVSKRIIIEHNYTNTGLCNGSDCTATNCSNFHFELGASVSRDGWREGNRLIELDILLNNLKYCRSCKLGPVPLTAYNVVGELQKGLGGYLYVVCQNPDCNFVNRVAYGKVHRMKTNGMPCFDVNTKLGTEFGHSSSVDIEKLPDAVPRGNFKPVKVESGQPTIIAIDLETTDLIRGSVMPHITQLAAVEVKSGAQFAVYTKPKMAVTSEAQRVTGICVDDNGDIVVNGNLVESIHIQSAIEKLCRWLDQFSNVFLIAHNGRRFDFPILMTAVLKTKTTYVFFKSVFGFVDSLSVFRKKYPGESLKQEDLARQHLGMTYNAHNAEADVEALEHLLELCEVSDLLNFSFSPVAVKNSLLFNCEKSKNLRSFDPLISKGICKRPTAENIAGSGLNVEHLKVIFRRSGEDGLRDTFTAVNCDGLPRVTNSKKFWRKLFPSFVSIFHQMYLHRHRYLYE